MSSKKFNPYKDFQSDQLQRSSRKIFTAHLRMQESQFEFDTSYGNDQRIHLTNNKFINRILGGTLDLSWL